MANLERTTRTSIEGGGFNMTEEGLQIIDDYLFLVKGHLPSTIADEVIEELRSYIREAASDNEEGIITARSAKKTVARFGAPSEVAEEYRYSMDIESMPKESAQTEASPEFVQEEGKIEDDTLDPTHEITSLDTEDESRKSDYFETLIQTIFLIVCWSLITGISGFPFSVFVVASQILAACILLPLYFLYRKSMNVILRNRTFEEWPWHLKVTTLPAGTFEPARQPFISMDMFILIIGIIGFAITSIAFPIALIAIPFILLRINIVRRYDTESFTPEDVKGEYVLNVFMAIILNFILGVAFWNFEFTAFVFVIPFCILYGFYLVFILATTMAELWTEVISISEPVENSVQQAPASVDEIRQYEKSEEATQAQDTILEVAPEKELEADRFRGLPVSYKRVVLKIMAISILWLTITGYFAGIMAPTYLGPWGAIIFLGVFQLPPILFVSIIKVLKMRRSKLLPWPPEDSNWSRLRKSLTFPDHVFDNQNTIFLRLDLLITFGIASLFILAIFVLHFLSAVFLVFSIIAGMTIIRGAFLNHRRRNPESERYNKEEFAITFLLLFIGNIIIVGFSSTFWSIHVNMQNYEDFVFQGTMFPVFLCYSWYLMYNLVARGKILWREDAASEAVTTASEHIPSTSKDRISLLDNLGTRFKQSLSRILAWYVLIVAISALVILFTTGFYSFITFTGTTVFLLYFWMLLLGLSVLSSITIVTLQFIYRRYMIKSGRSEHIIGKRGRIQVFLDLIITGVLLGALLMYWSTEMYSFIYSIQNVIPLNFTRTFFLLQISILVAVVLLWGALMGRLFSDLADSIRPGSATGTRLVIISGIMLALSTAIFVAYSIILSSGHYRIIFGVEILAQVSFLVIAITQIVTSQMKQSQKEELEKIEVEVEQALEEEPESNGPPIIESS